MQFVVKVIVSALIIAGVSEIAKRLAPIAAILASLPLTSILAMIWLYRDTKDIERVVELSHGIFWAVLPSLLFFVVLPVLLKSGLRFSWAIVLASAIMFIGYTVYVAALGKLGLRV